MTLSRESLTSVVYMIMPDSPQLHVMLLPYGCISGVGQGLHYHELTRPGLHMHVM